MTQKATLKQAEAARDHHADRLANLGAHAVGVEQAGDGWIVVAQVEAGTIFEGPDKLATTFAGKTVDVPLKLLRSAIAKPD